MNLAYTYGGTVEVNQDPLKLGRLKVRVCHAYGITGSETGYVSTDNLPWAMPAGMPAGGSASSGGFSHLPAIGDKVWVRFLDGEPEKPLWEWGMQSYQDAEALKLHSYKPSSNNGVGDPDRAFWTRYSQGVELNLGGIIISTSSGYRALFNDASLPSSFDGSLKLSSALGSYFEIDDSLECITTLATGDISTNAAGTYSGISFDFNWKTTASDVTFNSGGKFSVIASESIEMYTADTYALDALSTLDISSIGALTLSTASSAELSAATSLTLSAATIAISTTTSVELNSLALTLSAATALTLTSSLACSILSTGDLVLSTQSAALMSGLSITLNASSINFGPSATEPIVLGTQLFNYLQALYTAFITHTHTNSAGVTTTPSVVIDPPGATMLSSITKCQ